MSGEGVRKIVVLGMMTKMPVAGVVWQTVHYLVGFQRLGYQVYYVEAHALNPSMFTDPQDQSGSARAAAFIDGVMRRFNLGDRWAYHALHDDGRCYGMSEGQLKQLYASADLIVNLHGGTEPQPEHWATNRLVYLETDPVRLQIELYDNLQQSIDFLTPHRAFFTFGENYGNPDCKLPVSPRFPFHPTRQPVLLDHWKPGQFRPTQQPALLELWKPDQVTFDSSGSSPGLLLDVTAGESGAFTTIGSWRQRWRQVKFQGEVYEWSKHHEFLKYLDLPGRCNQTFELALSSYTKADKRLLESNGWKVRHALDFCMDLDAYRQYIAGSRGEFTVAKDQNVRLRSGWFSDRSATYLAAGRPVITQDTGFGAILPTGEGLFAFSNLEDIEEALESINSNYLRHCRAASEIAREYFSHDVVLKRLLQDAGL
jgi:hypothetical protein